MIPLVSIVMPAYGHEHFVGPAIESILAQTLDDWELIVIDDCSPDDTWEKIRQFQDPRIITSRHQENRGAHATINEGLARARGSYVAILNSDDVYYTERLERMVGYLSSSEIDLVGSAVRLIDAAGVLIEDQEHDWIRWYSRRLSLLRDNIGIRDALWGGNLFVTTSNFVFRRALASRVGGFADLRYAHDYAFLLAVITQSSASVAFLREEPLLYYRWHAGNTIRENEWTAGREEFGVICQYLPLLLPKDGRTGAEIALQHLSALALIAPNTDVAEVLRLHAEIATLVSQLGGSRFELGHLRSELGHLRSELEYLRTEISVLRKSYSFRVGSALFYPLRRLRGLVTGRS
jgi:glycosyltransferase involved in cell wall biosynthesis